MRTISFLRTHCLAATLGLLALTPAYAEGTLTIMVGEPDGVHAEIAFSTDKASEEAIVISTFLAGVSGSRLAIRVDTAPKPVYEYFFTDDDCKFAEGGSQCRTTISGTSETYPAVVTAFKRGLVAHVEVETAGSMEMSNNATLVGFTRGYKGL